MPTNIETLRTANWDSLEADVLTRIRLLKGMAQKLEPNAVNDRIAAELIGPAVELLAQFCLCVQIEEENEGEGS